MKAVADLFRLVAGRNLEFDSLPFDPDDLGFGSNIVAHRRSGKVPDIYRSAHRALAHIQKRPDGIEGCVFHDQDHNRGRQHLRQHGVLELIGKMLGQHAQRERSLCSHRDLAHSVILHLRRSRRCSDCQPYMKMDRTIPRNLM